MKLAQIFAQYIQNPFRCFSIPKFGRISPLSSSTQNFKRFVHNANPVIFY